MDAYYLCLLLQHTNKQLFPVHQNAVANDAANRRCFTSSTQLTLRSVQNPAAGQQRRWASRKKPRGNVGFFFFLVTVAGLQLHNYTLAGMCAMLQAAD